MLFVAVLSMLWHTPGLQVWDEEELDTDALKAEAKAREKERKKAAKRKKVRGWGLAWADA